MRCGGELTGAARGGRVLNHTASSTGDVPEFSPSVQQGLGSVSKLAAAATFMAAVVDTGKGSLDAPIRETLPDVFAAGGAQGGDATPRMLLSHTSGFNDAVYDAGTVGANKSNPHHDIDPPPSPFSQPFSKLQNINKYSQPQVCVVVQPQSRRV